MKNELKTLLLVSGCLLAVACAPTSQRPEAPNRGVVVERVKPNSSAAAAGLGPDDVLLAWRRSDGVDPQQGLERGDLDAAEGYLRRALAIRERLAPDSLPLATT